MRPSHFAFDGVLAHTLRSRDRPEQQQAIDSGRRRDINRTPGF
jgi:hypothetical protein